jgi:hypothetical protein
MSQSFAEAELVAFLEVSEALFNQMIEQQRAKVMRLAREAVPYISAEDVMNPNDFPELKAHPTFDYEDGILAGLISAQVAMRAELRGRLPGVDAR